MEENTKKVKTYCRAIAVCPGCVETAMVQP